MDILLISSERLFLGIHPTRMGWGGWLFSKKKSFARNETKLNGGGGSSAKTFYYEINEIARSTPQSYVSNAHPMGVGGDGVWVPKNLLPRIAWNIQICTKKIMYGTPTSWDWVQGWR